MKYETPIDRIIANSTLSNESAYGEAPCWLWLGKVRENRSGMRYGVLNTRFKAGPRKGKVRTEWAHRFVVRAVKGRILTPRMVVRHLCNNTLCVNPAHLVGGTQKSNMRQMVREGRHRNAYSEARA